MSPSSELNHPAENPPDHCSQYRPRRVRSPSTPTPSAERRIEMEPCRSVRAICAGAAVALQHLAVRMAKAVAVAGGDDRPARRDRGDELRRRGVSGCRGAEPASRRSSRRMRAAPSPPLRSMSPVSSIAPPRAAMRSTQLRSLRFAAPLQAGGQELEAHAVPFPLPRPRRSAPRRGDQAAQRMAGPERRRHARRPPGLEHAEARRRCGRCPRG